MLRIRSCLVLVLVGVQMAGGLQAETLADTAVVVDGDTLKVAGETVRLHGIDAPELRQDCADGEGSRWACGVWAAKKLAELAAGEQVVCAGQDRDRYGRLVARCRVDGADLGEALVERGAAFAYRRYSLDYVDAEKRAFISAAGIWKGDADLPEDFRSTKHPAPQPARADGCAIKGNISKSGQIYHLPGQADYDATRINPSKGERWFCSEEEAQAAGWRRARR